ncbi:MAG: zf-HC2 domain-containing protein [Ruminococcus sp.]|nr:zf-HC2 domain-containing protein [Ruminococcus sp.]
MLRCEIVQDLLPIYTENMVSPYTAQEVNSHLAGCAECSAKFKEMSATAPNVQMRMDTAQQFINYQKKTKKKTILPVIIIAAIVVFLIFIGSVVAILALVGAFSYNPVTSENYHVLEYDPFVDFNLDEDKQNYSLYMGENALKEYRNKLAMDESIFPAELTEEMEVLNYKMLYHNSFDPQYLSYLTVTYSPEDYEKEIQRLNAYESTNYKGIYGVTGFNGGEPLAVYTDEYYGFVYAINTPDTENTITYCELIFCNYFMDVEYEDFMPAEYLPDGFDATNENPYRKKKLKEEGITDFVINN